MKSRSQDLTPYLRAWEYDESQTVRRFRTPSGRDVIQVRLPLGMEQYEIDGRPDGKRPMQRESWLHHYWRLAKEATSESRELELSSEDFARLHHEGLLYYHRYLLCFQIQEYKLCARDTRRNLKLVELVRRHAAREQAELIEQYEPYILRMNFMARALFRVKELQDLRGALRILHAGQRAIVNLKPLPDNRVFELERARSLKSLEELMSQLEAYLPHHVVLSRQLERAVEEENYERAASLRDEIAALKRSIRGEASGG
ncbi:MAG: UvrB/UvrC motif-containing protein [Planctomycetes bacterium]|nr:UvrB/UvrC motif-containing protein [Planctomycetota bacterium]